MNTVGAVSIKRTHEILSGVFSIPISTGTIASMVKRCADRVTDTVDKIKEKLIHSALNHFDETGTRTEGKLYWVHSASNALYTLLHLNKKRGAQGMDECGILPEFQGIAVHDCWASYWNYPDAEHAVCCAHLLRELTGIHENHPEQTWAPAFIDLLLEMKKVKEKAIIKGKTGLSYYHLHKFDKNYDNLIELAKKRKSTSGNHGKETWPEEKGKNPCVGGTSGDIQDLSLPFYP
ncbi:MAG: IS66 family transposase [Lacrimispora saccharolytica]